MVQLTHKTKFSFTSFQDKIICDINLITYCKLKIIGFSRTLLKKCYKN